MISDLTRFPTPSETGSNQPLRAVSRPAANDSAPDINNVAIVPHGTGLGLEFVPPPALTQPVVHVRAYLECRRPVALCDDELPLLLTLPECEANPLRSETRALCSACVLVAHQVSQGASVQRACKEIIAMFPASTWKLATFRQKYDWWAKSRDWTVLVNCARAGGDWIDRAFGLPGAFLDFCAGRIGEFKRRDGETEALRSIQRQWQSGLNHRGDTESVPGYTSGWDARNRAKLPVGWSISNIRRQLKARAKLRAAEKALLHHGIASARAHLPQVRSTREGLRFMEEVQFDDVKCDFRVFDTATGKPVDLWLLIAHDRATAMLLGFGMRPATVREDGSQTHLKLQDMKQLSGWLLERYGLPPYPMTWKVENGTATYDEGTAGAVTELLKGRLNVSFSLMIRGNSPSGYLERALGNSKGKASLESHNRLMHLIGAGLPGQVGPHYGARPMDLAAREREAELIWRAAAEFPAGLCDRLRAEFGYPLLTLQQARRELVKIFSIRNARTDHKLEGFERVVVNTPAGPVQRMESPAERANRLCDGLQFSSISPEIIAAFYEHTQRSLRVDDDGHLYFTHEGRLLEFMPPPGQRLTPGLKVLGYFHPDDPRFVHITDGRGVVLGTWLRRALVRNGDRVALAQAMELQASALKAAKTRAAELNSGEVHRLAAMREHNARLLNDASFVDVSQSAISNRQSAIISPVASALTAARAMSEKIKDDPGALPLPPVADCTDELLKRSVPSPEDETWD